ncbi:hypothetical protein, partial [Streptococcus mitis]|uniref:hypothetical protein n=1 Tax=Streptococcus mitis TaxID=28037 RepID=UPI0021BAB1F9
LAEAKNLPGEVWMHELELLDLATAQSALLKECAKVLHEAHLTLILCSLIDRSGQAKASGNSVQEMENKLKKAGYGDE